MKRVAGHAGASTLVLTTGPKDKTQILCVRKDHCDRLSPADAVDRIMGLLAPSVADFEGEVTAPWNRHQLNTLRQQAQQFRADMIAANVIGSIPAVKDEPGGSWGLEVSID